MNRFERYHRSYDYNNASAHSSWDTKTSIGVEQGDDDDAHSRVNLTRRPAASVIGYDDLDFWPRTRPNTRDRDRDRNRNRDLNSPRLRQRDGHGHRASLRPSLSSGPTLTTGTSTTTTDREWEKERDFSNLKQRLSLAGRSPPSLTFISGNYPHHHRARSLSLTRLSASAAGSVYSDISSSSLEDDEDDSDMEPWWGSTGRGRQGRGHRVLPLAPGSPPLPRRHRQTTDSPSPKYYRHARLSLSPPERHERGYQVVPAPVPPPTCVSVGGGAARDETAAERHADDLRARLGGLDVRERLPNPRVSSSRHHAGHARKRSESYERFKGVRNGRKGLSPAAGARANSKHRGLKPQYNQVHALILTWSFHDLRTEDYTAPPASDYVSLEEETAQLRGTLEGYGYTVHEFLIPMHRSVERLKAKLKQFCRYAADDTLLIVYYHGHGALDGDNELVFSSHDHPENPEWAKAAAAELYAALMCGDTCSTHGRRDKYQELLKKYERYRPVSTIKWDTLRGPILSAPCDVLLAAGHRGVHQAPVRRLRLRVEHQRRHDGRHVRGAA
ncbi:hypothetical protein N657DRAFT_693200 [Parathielavia appendiculata]|uniref:Uncharacterized protein n=1 Tax=Parathielavia appendiculata TaxID=2587402 RepID=A0AAN6Z191_9PEZI|nr:hypothetical protein N657DRAFT_693200 [Parathielavia appendiculata]